MKRLIIFSLALQAGLFASAQKENPSIVTGNNLYKQNNFKGSAAEYKKALTLAPENPVANYNLGNASFKSNDYETAVGSYEMAIKNGKDKPTKEKSHYNQGVSYSKQQKLAESIEAWKNALKLDPEDNEARENLQKALLEKKKQDEENKKKQDEQKKDKNKDKEKDKKEEDKKDKEKSEPQQPQQQPSKLNQKQVEQLLKALAQKEKELQDRMQSKNASPVKQDKDW